MGTLKANLENIVGEEVMGVFVYDRVLFCFVLDQYLGHRQTLVTKKFAYRWQTYTAGILSLSALETNVTRDGGASEI